MFYPVVSPHNPDYALVACDMTGAFVTKNGGESWRMFNLRGPVDYFVFDPLDSNTVYANSIALFKSADRGNTWSVFYPQPSEIKGVVSKDGAKNIFVAPSSPKDNRTIYIAWNTSVTRKENGNWKTNNGPKEVKHLTAYSGGYDQKKNKYIIYAISGKSYFNPEGDQSGIYYTEDGGETWENRQEGMLQFRIEGAEIPEWRSIATSAWHPEVLYVSYNNLQVHNDTTCIGVARSEDYGKTWKLSWKDILTKGGNIPSRNFKSGWINNRFGPTWGENPFSIGVSPVNPDVCYGTDFGRTIKTVDGGKTWEQVYTNSKQGGGWISRGLEVTTGYSVVFDPAGRWVIDLGRFRYKIQRFRFNPLNFDKLGLVIGNTGLE